MTYSSNPQSALTKNNRRARSRRQADLLAARGLWVLAGLPVALVAILALALMARSWPIVQAIPLQDLLWGETWLPGQGKFGFAPFIVGTFWVTVVALILAAPPCLLAAIFLAEYARPRLSALVKPLLDLLAAIPSVVYGVWGMVTIVPAVQAAIPWVDKTLGFIPLFSTRNPTGYGILSGGIVLAVMVAPFMIAVIYEVLRTVPDGYREASLAVGATRWQTVKYAILPQTAPGIVAAIVLGASRALGETMAVLMVVGNVARLPGSIFDPAYPLPALIANNYGEMMSIPLYDAALMTAALILLLIVLAFNVFSNLMLRRIMKEKLA